jgi:hypothetical protein
MILATKRLQLYRTSLQRISEAEFLAKKADLCPAHKMNANKISVCEGLLPITDWIWRDMQFTGLSLED